LRILITNNTLSARAGSELYVRDLASSLLKRGHTPIAYSTNLGEVAKELRELTIPVVDDLALISEPPELIHGQHHIETMTAVVHFPNVPAVFFCHGWMPWEETPPRFPRILRYVAVDHTCRDRLIYEHAIPQDRVQVFLNFVDLQRFSARAGLPAQPKRALVFSNQMDERTGLGAIHEACARRGIEVDAIGIGVGRPEAQPEKLLGQYDLVFAKARCALEALAVGTAVVLCDATGVGPMVTAGNLVQLRQFNFGRRALQEPVCVESLEKEISRYDPNDAAEVSRRIRATAALEPLVDELVTLYQEVLKEHSSISDSQMAAEETAAAAYLRWVTTYLRNERQSLFETNNHLNNALIETRTRLTNDLIETRERCHKTLIETWKSINNSTTARLREYVLRVPLLGTSARFLARKTLGQSPAKNVEERRSQR
jgi:hypothetical protein